MNFRIELQPAYVLHSRPYQDTSLIVELITADYGRIAVVARGARKGKKRQSQQLQPFIPLLMSCQGKSELKTLTGVETTGEIFFFTGKVLYSLFYINELLLRLLPVQDPHPRIYQCYGRLLSTLRDGAVLESCLREFEFFLLDEMGYALPFTHDASTGLPLQPDIFYRFEPENGFTACVPGVRNNNDNAIFSGKVLCDIAAGQYGDDNVRRSAKRLARLALNPHLGGRPLKSRELFMPLVAR